MKVEYIYFSEKLEAIEIQANETGPDYEKGCNLDNRQYVTTNFWKPILRRQITARGHATATLSLSLTLLIMMSLRER